MNIEVFKAFRQFATDQGLLFHYHGTLSQPIIAAMGEALRARLEIEDASAKATRKVFSTFVEMLQNIVHYASGDPADAARTEPFGNVTVGRLGERYYIVSGNAVAEAHVVRLRSKLDAIRAMSEEEIKAEYRRKLRTDERDENSKGAGLGFLTLARDASEPIEYCFEPMPGALAGLSFFYLKATI
jgi:hypothetical protein